MGFFAIFCNFAPFLAKGSKNKIRKNTFKDNNDLGSRRSERSFLHCTVVKPEIGKV